ncbi:dicarboxylate/amino acid:cation symporter [Temperatibacter marinus]|uniref:Dicarboxylate/amino acid:cation symporter n=1 Tax=Temperatibacter marinus TaxID=1456591 RepID=A0AA52EDA4_9PROT|nr:dicarboxylate/amino acid:cation symporter [Temperatibacter marinus]WND02580.1 dicarboxylate/amino acid:cation symporter [Temperatibacter marinus]
MLKAWFDTALWKRVLLALILGVIAGSLWGEGATAISWLGDMFIRLIRMVIVPLVFLTLVSGVIAMGDPKRLGSIGIKTIMLYMGTTAVAIVIGLVLATLIQPGVGVDLAAAGTESKALVRQAMTLDGFIEMLIPKNPVKAMVDAKMLQIIFFGVMFGAALMMTKEDGKPVANVIEAGSEVMLKMTHMVMEMAPFGVFALIATTAGTQGASALLDVVPLVVTVVGGCIIHVLVTHGIIMKFLLGLPPVRFFKDIIEPQLVAFSTSSSSATLPVTMATAEDNLGIKAPVASSVLPLGSTINMDGTGIYVGAVAIFAAQALGIDLSLIDYLLIAASTTLVSIGTAAVPSASLFLLTAVLSVIGVSGEQTAIIVGFLFAFDRPLDMCRTVVNVTGDLSVATAVAKWEDEIDEDVFRDDPKV